MQEIPRFGRRRRERIMRRARHATDANTYRRFHALYLLTGGFSVIMTAQMLAMARSTIYKALDRYRDTGLDGLEDLRSHNGKVKADVQFRVHVEKIVAGSPQDYGWCRPTWTRELLCLTMKRIYGVRVSNATMGRVLSCIGARLGRPRSIVCCPWSTRRRKHRLAQIHGLEHSLPSNELLFYQDEVDIHLNPKVGYDWMIRGQQKLLKTPGKNERRYIAGALQFSTGEIIWVEGRSKCSALFCDNIDAIMARHRRAKRIHVVLDNYIIHKSKITQKRLERHKARLVLHFLPPYCPSANRIERKWQDLHAQVTRNHTCSTMEALMAGVRAHLNRVGQVTPLRHTGLQKAA